MRRGIYGSALLAMLLVVVGLGLPTAMAHATIYTPDDKVKFVFGHIGEPVYTFQKTGLDLGISANATGEPITGLEAIDHDGRVNPKLRVTYVYSGTELNISDGFRAQHGKVGWYTYPVMFTKPGVYALRIQGNIGGTMVDQVLQPAHAIEAIDVIMWPDQVALPDQQDDDIATLKSEVASLQSQVATLQQKGGNAPTFGAFASILVIALAFAWTLRRRD